MAAGPKPFTDTIVSMRYGTLVDDLTKAMNELTAKCADTGRAGSLILTLQLKPGKGGQIEVFDDIKVKSPKEERGSSVFFATPDGNLTRDDPKQLQIEGLRTVDMETGELRRVGQTN
jgi:hypothetical protein